QAQQIRFPSMIEEHGLATCLDTALLFAAAIEQAGLFPVVVFTEGHALAGAWLQPKALSSLTVEDPMEIRKAIAQQDLLLFETTMATGGHAMPLSRAVAEAGRQVSEEYEGRFVYAIDIRQARGRDIQPLSSVLRPVQRSEEQEVDSARAAPPIDEAPDLPPFDDDTADAQTPQTPEARLEDKLAQGERMTLITPPPERNTTDVPDRELYHLRTGESFIEKFALEALEPRRPPKFPHLWPPEIPPPLT